MMSAAKQNGISIIRCWAIVGVKSSGTPLIKIYVVTVPPLLFIAWKIAAGYIEFVFFVSHIRNIPVNVQLMHIVSMPRYG